MLSTRQDRLQAMLLVLVLLQSWGALLLSRSYGWPAGVLLLLLLPAAVLFRPALPEAIAALQSLRGTLRIEHGVWVLLMLSSMSFRTRDTSDIRDMPLDIWAAYRVGLVGVIVVVLSFRFGLAPLLRSVSHGTPRHLLAFALLMLASSVWSVYPAWTGYKACEYLVDVAVLAAVMTRIVTVVEMRRMFNLTWTMLAASVAAVWLGIVIAPGAAIATGIGLIGIQIQGVFPEVSSNGVGDLSATLGIIVLNRMLTREGHRKAMYRALFVVCLVTLLLAQTRSAATGFAVSAAVVLVLSGRKKLFAVVGLVALVLVVWTSAGDVLHKYVMRDQSDELFYSLSGRTTWWEAALDRVVERPLLGYGAFAGARFATLEAIGSTTTSSIHNTYMEVLLGTGIVGLSSFLLVYLGTWARLLKSIRLPLTPPERELLVEITGLFTFLSMRSLFSTNMVWHGSLDFLLILAFAEYLRRRVTCATVYLLRPQPVSASAVGRYS